MNKSKKNYGTEDCKDCKNPISNSLTNSLTNDSFNDPRNKARKKQKCKDATPVDCGRGQGYDCK